jgi:hypothetical protein
MWIIYIFLSLLSGVLYHLGGLGDDGAKKYPKLPKWMFNTKMRDWVCSLCNLGLISLLFGWVVWWQYLGVFLLSWGFLSTYHGWLNKFFKKPEDNVYWFNWFTHGFCLGLPLLLLITIIPIWGVLLICLGMGISMMIWSQLISLAWLEEGGRGFLFIFITYLVSSFFF